MVKQNLPVVKRQIDAPEVKTLAPDGDFFSTICD